MSNVLEVAEVPTGQRPPIVVVRRGLLWQGGVVEIKVSADAQDWEFTTPEGQQFRYLKFYRGVHGGHINCFLHTRNPALRGTKVTARVEVWQKKLDDGREFLYLDFHQTRDVATHTLVVAPGKPDEAAITEGSLVFETPETSTSIRFGCEVQSIGTIILTPIEEKVVPEISSEPAQPEAVEQAPKVDRVKTGDLVLDRKVNDEGWKIDGDIYAPTVTLFKEVNGRRREITHYRKKDSKKIGKR